MFTRTFFAASAKKKNTCSGIRSAHLYGLFSSNKTVVLKFWTCCNTPTRTHAFYSPRITFCLRFQKNRSPHAMLPSKTWYDTKLCRIWNIEQHIAFAVTSLANVINHRACFKYYEVFWKFSSLVYGELSSGKTFDIIYAHPPERIATNHSRTMVEQQIAFNLTWLLNHRAIYSKCLKGKLLTASRIKVPPPPTQTEWHFNLQVYPLS